MTCIALLDNGYGVRLDHRSLRTPLRKVFCVPSQTLAMAVAQEWRTQSSTIQPALMHLVCDVDTSCILCKVAINIFLYSYSAMYSYSMTQMIRFYNNIISSL